MTTGLLGIVVLGALGGCGGGGDETVRAAVPDGTLTVYLSAPRDGDSAAQAKAVTAGARLALREADGRAAGRDVRLVALSSTDPDGGAAGSEPWNAAAIARNAGRAASDPSAIAYIGELDLGGSAVSVPITNDAGLLQVSPSDGLTSLTRRLPSDPGTGPERYYPGEARSFLRLVPNDFLQASALVQWARLAGARRLVILHDGGVFGRELAGEAAFAADCEGLEASVADQVGADAASYAALAEDVADERPDAILYAGAAGQIAEPLAAALATELPSARQFAAGGVANRPPPRAVGLGSLLAVSAEDTLVTRAPRPRASYPRAGRRVLARLERLGGAPVATDALYGYEAMSIVLGAADDVGEVRDRDAVRDRALEPRVRRSVLGSYRIEPSGDVSEVRFGGYRRAAASLAFEAIRRPAYELAPPSPKLAEPLAPCGALLRAVPTSQ